MTFIIKIVTIAKDGAKTVRTHQKNGVDFSSDRPDVVAAELLEISPQVTYGAQNQLPPIAGYMEVQDGDPLLTNESYANQVLDFVPGNYIVISGKGTKDQFFEGVGYSVEKRWLLAEYTPDGFPQLYGLSPRPGLHTPRDITEWKKKFGSNVFEFITHPGTWTFLALLMVGMGIAFPVAAPALIIAALAFTAAATLSLFLYIPEYVQKLREEARHAKGEDGRLKYPDLENTSTLTIAVDKFMQWTKEHPWQTLAVTLGLALVITTLVLTIGFFTGGGALVVAGGAVAATGGGMFAFMAPVFATIAAPLATAASAAGLAIANIAFTATVGGLFVLAALNVTNLAKRFLQWIDEFRWKGHAKGVAYQDGAKFTLVDEAPPNLLEQAADAIDEAFEQAGIYCGEVIAGMRGRANTLFKSMDAQGKVPFPDDEVPLSTDKYQH